MAPAGCRAALIPLVVSGSMTRTTSAVDAVALPEKYWTAYGDGAVHAGSNLTVYVPDARPLTVYVPSAPVRAQADVVVEGSAGTASTHTSATAPPLAVTRPVIAP